MTDRRVDARPADGGRALLSGLHALLGAFPLAYFVLAFVTDLIYTRAYIIKPVGSTRSRA